MASFKTFEEIIAWQKAEVLTLAIYKQFKSSKDYGFRDQIQRAAVSVMNNIAEGYERHGNKEFRHFLFIAKGSCGEIRSMIRLAVKLGYIDQEAGSALHSLAAETSKLLSGLIKTL